MYSQSENINPSSAVISRRFGSWTVSTKGEGRFRHPRAFRRLDALRIESGTITSFKTGFKNKLNEIIVEADPILGYLSIAKQMIDDVEYVIIKGTSERLELI